MAWESTSGIWVNDTRVRECKGAPLPLAIVKALYPFTAR